MRKRPYLAIHVNGTREILNLKFKPSPSMFANTSIKSVEGPFCTWDEACDALEHGSGEKAKIIRRLRRDCDRMGMPQSFVDSLLKDIPSRQIH